MGCYIISSDSDKSRPSVCFVLPGAELTEGLEGGGGHVAESSVVAQQQEGQHLKSQQHKHTNKKIKYNICPPNTSPQHQIQKLKKFNFTDIVMLPTTL